MLLSVPHCNCIMDLSSILFQRKKKENGNRINCMTIMLWLYFLRNKATLTVR